MVTVTLHLNGAAARTYRRRHRLTVRVRETFTPTHGAALVKLATVTLRAPTPTLAQQCAEHAAAAADPDLPGAHAPAPPEVASNRYSTSSNRSAART